MIYRHKITVTIHTASKDNFLAAQGIESYFENICVNLSRQYFKSFELVYIDTFYEENRQKFDEIFPKYALYVKHVPIHHEHRYWFDIGATFISAAKNTGILYADGELIVSIDDAEFLPDDLLMRYWAHYQSKRYMLGLHKRLKNIVTHEGKINYPIRGDEYINDHRFLGMKKDVEIHNFGTTAFAGTSFSLLDALRLNGFNERMDGCKSLEDCDFGYRLQRLGRKFAYDNKGFVYILDHPCYASMLDSQILTPKPDNQMTFMEPVISKKKIESKVCVENYAVHMFAVELNEVRANTGVLTEQHYNILQRETLKYRNFDPLAEENKNNFEIWKNVPSFNLTEQREQLRSKDWRF